MSETTNLKMQLPDGTDWADVETLNQNFQKVDAAMPGANVKETPADTDKVLLYDSEDKALVGKPKKVLLSKLIELWENTFCTKDELSSSLLEKVSVPIEIAANSDLNNFRNCGFYFCGNGGETISNKPGTSDAFGAFSLLVQKTGSWGGNGVNQILTDYTNGNLYVRSSENASWTVWKGLATTADLANYLPLSGGTLTGTLKSTSPLNGIQIFATDTRSTKIMKNASAAVEDGTHIVDYADGKYTTLKISARTNSVSLRDSSGGDNIIYGAHNVTTGTTALTAGTSALATGAYYNQYE